MDLPATASLAEFARLAGFKRAYVSQLQLAGRLVMADDGKSVRVAESLARIEATRDQPDPPPPAEATFAQFAFIAGCRPSYVTQLKADGRLVLTEDGKRVRVAESIERIAATRDPSKAGVVERHAAARGDGLSIPTTEGEEGGDPEGDTEGAGEGYQYWRARNEKAKALASERENAIADGRLLDVEAVTAAVTAAVTTLRTSLESLPSTLGPELAATTDEGVARALLADAIEHALEELARQFGALARTEVG